jgi:hypothetical protein
MLGDVLADAVISPGRGGRPTASRSRCRDPNTSAECQRVGGQGQRGRRHAQCRLPHRALPAVWRSLLSSGAPPSRDPFGDQRDARRRDGRAIASLEERSRRRELSASASRRRCDRQPRDVELTEAIIGGMCASACTESVGAGARMHVRNPMPMICASRGESDRALAPLRLHPVALAEWPQSRAEEGPAVGGQDACADAKGQLGVPRTPHPSTDFPWRQVVC